MNKNLFINIITALQEQYDDDLAKAYLLGQVLDLEANPYDNSKLSDAIFKLLKLYFKDKTSDIETFCWEQNFGRMNNVSIEKLWDFLQEPIKFKNNWDDEENDATYSKNDLVFNTIKCENGIVWHMEQSKEFDKLFGNKVSEEIKNIEVKDIIIISPLKKK